MDSLINVVIAGLIMLIAQFFLQPIIQRKIKAQEELWLYKKNAYIRSVSLIDERFDSMKYKDSEPISVGPSMQEVNEVYRELMVVCNNEEILTMFSKFMDASTLNYCSPANRGAYIKLLRKDLGNSKLVVKDEKIPYFRHHSKA